MQKQIKVIKFLPYFPPHKGGLESHVQEWSKWWIKEEHGEVLNITFGVGQKEGIFAFQEYGYGVIVIPAFDIVPNFPFPKFWSKDFWRALSEARKFDADIINTHTRFFLSSLLGGIFAKITRKKWAHIEHGSDYVGLDSKVKNSIAWLYDQIIGRWVFFGADEVIAISQACRGFIQRFSSRKVPVFYRGLDVIETGLNGDLSDLKTQFPDKIIIGFIGRLYKWKNVESFIRAYYSLDPEMQSKIQPVIVGYGEDLDRLKNLDVDKKFYFTGGKDSSIDLATQSQFDIHIHTSSPGGGLATTLLQAMYLGCFIVATPYEGANEVIVDGENGILLRGDSVADMRNGISQALSRLGKRDEFAIRNEKIIYEKFSWKKNIENYFNFYQ